MELGPNPLGLVTFPAKIFARARIAGAFCLFDRKHERRALSAVSRLSQSGAARHEPGEQSFRAPASPGTGSRNCPGRRRHSRCRACGRRPRAASPASPSACRAWRDCRPGCGDRGRQARGGGVGQDGRRRDSRPRAPCRRAARQFGVIGARVAGGTGLCLRTRLIGGGGASPPASAHDGIGRDEPAADQGQRCHGRRAPAARRAAGRARLPAPRRPAGWRRSSRAPARR
jgi:hypothetical protein